MGPNSAAEMDAWLLGGGRVVTASERSARALSAAYHRARRAEGLTAWPAPAIQDWDGFVRAAWLERCLDDRMTLNALQEQSLWAEIVSRDGQRAALLEGPRHRVAQMAMDAHRLLCLYAPQFLRTAARTGWQQDAGVFSKWLAAFEDVCRTQRLLSAARLPLELTEILQSEAGERAPLVVSGFDRILPTQRALLDAYGAWRETSRDESAAQVAQYEAGDEQTELAACAVWCKRQLAANPHARLLIVTQEAARRRGEMERALLRFLPDDSANPAGAPLFEFSLGVPLQQIALARGAHLLLRWLTDVIDEQALDWLFSSGVTAAGADESQALTAFMRAIRRRGGQRARWRLDAFMSQRPGETLPTAWAARMTQAKRRLEEFGRAHSTPSQREGSADATAWAELVAELLRMAGWPGGRALSSAEFQVMRRWQRIVDECASLGFDGRRVRWRDFLATIERALRETLFAPESQDAPILIVGPTESAGITADAIWFMGAHEDAWPASGTTHPLLPLEVQRGAEMPHATAQLDWNLAAAVTDRLLCSAPQLCFSYARQSEGVEARPSRLIAKLAGTPQPLPAELHAPKTEPRQTVEFEDHSRIPFPLANVPGGSSVLTAQSQCAFKAFAKARLGAESWEPAEAALTAAQRGQLLHAVLHSVWSGSGDGIRSHEKLTQILDLRAFVEEHVRRALIEEMPAAAREEMPQRYLELEETRLVELVTEWLRYEQARVPFTVEETEADANASIHGLALKLRLDRIDRLNDGTVLVIDYKSGNVSPTSWELPRPDDVQLPLYAGFALDREAEPVGGLVFAKVRAGQHGFAGRVLDAQGQLLRGLSPRSGLVKRPFTIEELIDWRTYIEKMAMDFVEGRADVNPREYPETCERCGLEALCRVRENRVADEDSGEGEEDDDA
jgi:probable DNA repair protein